MATIKTGLSKLNANGLVAKADYVIDMLTANAATFPAPSPALAVLTTEMNALRDAISAATEGGKAAHQAKRDQSVKLRDLLKAEADYVANIAQGDARKILDGGFDVRSARTPSVLPSAPRGLEARLTGITTTVSLDWATQHEVRLYHVYMTSQDPASANAVWTLVGTSTKTRHVIADLESYRAYWFKVTAINVVGESPASDVLMARAA